MEKQGPHFVARKTGELIINKEYAAWLADVKQNFRSCQAKAAVRVNSAMLEFYWNLGRDICRLHAEAKWGTAFFENLSLDLRHEFPDQKGFSVTNLKYTKLWYLFYYERIINRQNDFDGIRQNHSDEFHHQLGDESQNAVNQLFPNRQNDFDELGMPECFALIPWGHHIQIFTSCNSFQEAVFYINRIIEEQWRGKDLKQNIKEGLYARQGKALTNFSDMLPVEQASAAQSVLKDPYHFGFLRLKERYSEQDLEDALTRNITNFLLELGAGFAFVGRQMELRMDDGTSYFPDLVFYHTRLHAYVVVELKIVDFMPEFAGKLNFYVNAANALLKGEGDNPTVGLLICKSANKTKVEWAFKGISTPIGVASYELEEVVNRTFAELPKETSDEY